VVLVDVAGVGVTEDFGVGEREDTGDALGDNVGVGEGTSVVEVGSRDSLIPPENKKTATPTRIITIMTKSISFFIPYEVAASQLYT